MRKHRVYIAADLNIDQQLTLLPEVKHYVGNVLRLKSGDTLHVFNGNGKEYSGSLYLDKKSAHLTLQAQTAEQSESKTRVHLLQAIARGDHMDFALQKATELGANTITPVLTARTQQHNKDRLDKRFKHWQSIIIHACEQSGRCYLPKLQPIVAYQQALADNKDQLKFVCQAQSKAIGFTTKPSSIAILIGPEGGLTDDEITLAQETQFAPASLGETILRTETAATCALGIVNYILTTQHD